MYFSISINVGTWNVERGTVGRGRLKVERETWNVERGTVGRGRLKVEG
jgi:hypothetical protein